MLGSSQVQVSLWGYLPTPPGRSQQAPVGPALRPRPEPRLCLQPRLSLENSVTTRFGDPGDVRVTVQAACGTSVLQDSKVVRVLGECPLPHRGKQRSFSFLGAQGRARQEVTHRGAGHPGVAPAGRR